MKKEIYAVIREEKNRLFKRVEINRAMLCGMGYYEIHIFKNAKKSHLLKLWREISSYAKTVILPKDIHPDELYLSLIRPYDPLAQLSELTVEKALNILNDNKENAVGISVCICDKSGKYARRAESFLPVCRELKVMTSNPAAYYRLSDNLFAKFGTEPIIVAHPEKNDFLILPRSHTLYINGQKHLLCTQGISLKKQYLSDVQNNSYGEIMLRLALYQKYPCAVCNLDFDFITPDGKISSNDIKINPIL